MQSGDEKGLGVNDHLNQEMIWLLSIFDKSFLNKTVVQVSEDFYSTLAI